METSQNVNSNVNKVLKNKKTYKPKSKDKKNIRNEVGTSQSKDSKLKKTSINKDNYEVESEDKYVRNEIETSQNEDNDVKKTLKNEYNDVKKTLKNMDKSEIESDESIEEEYCSDVTYLARQLASTERLNHSDTLTLYNLHVRLRHAVPPQHRIETRAGSHIPTREEIGKFEKIISIKKGLYSAEEDKLITGNWNAFCKLHNWNVRKVQPFLQLRIGRITYMRNTAERRRFVQFLADGLLNRTLYSVYHRFKNLYKNNVQRRYKPEEDKMIIDHLENNPSLDEKRKYADLAKVLRRTRNSIWRRYRILKREKQDT